MYRIKIKTDGLNLKVEQVDIPVDSEEEAQAWARRQLALWGVPEDKIEEVIQLEKLDLLLEDE